jgi:APA family basic amino acid/polyamine antiporter
MAEPTLRRELGTAGAVLMGLGSIVGTGVFVSIGIAAGIAGPAVLAAIFIAALVAACNGLNSAQLAAAHPVSGGTYEYGYTFLGPALGFTAGWMFLIAKSASAATAALGFSGYLLRTVGLSGATGGGVSGATGSGLGDATKSGLGDATVPVALLAVAVLTAIAAAGIRGSSRTNIVIVSVTLLALGLFVAFGADDALRGAGGALTPFISGGQAGSFTVGTEPAAARAPAWRLLSASALMFVAFTGYGRIATLGEEVREPKRTIPRAVIVTLVSVTLIYGAVAAVAVAGVGWEALAAAVERSPAPLEEAAFAVGGPALAVAVAVGAMTAMLGVLLNLVLGLSRVLLAMGRRRDMPALFSRLNRTGTAPTAAVIGVGVVVALLVLLGDVRVTWSFSAFTVLIYYAVTNAAAFALPAGRRRYGRWLAVAGFLGCAGLAAFVEPLVVLIGVGLIAVGLLWYGAAAWRRRWSTSS